MTSGTIIFHYIIFNPEAIDYLPELSAFLICLLNFFFPGHSVVKLGKKIWNKNSIEITNSDENITYDILKDNFLTVRKFFF